MMKKIFIALLCLIPMFIQASWYDSTPFAGCDTDRDQEDSGYIKWTVLTSVTGGTASKLRIAISTVQYDATGFKIALYSGDGSALLASVTTVLNIADSNTQKEFTISDTVIATGNYIVAWDALANNTDVVYKAKSATTGTIESFSDGSYFTFPPATLTAGDFTNPTVSAGVFVTESSSPGLIPYNSAVFN